ncbi:MAG: hypothetical protein ACLS6O_09150 [Bifidobacterium sp.]
MDEFAAENRGAARGTDVETRELIKDVLKAIPASAAKVAVGELRNDKEGMRDGQHY